MVIEKQPFKRYSLEDSKTDVINIWLNPKDRAMIEDSKAILRQAKDSTTLKTLAEIGYAKLKSDASISLILDRFEAFQRRNKRTGVLIETPKLDIPNMNVGENITETETRP